MLAMLPQSVSATTSPSKPRGRQLTPLVTKCLLPTPKRGGRIVRYHQLQPLVDRGVAGYTSGTAGPNPDSPSHNQLEAREAQA